MTGLNRFRGWMVSVISGDAVRRPTGRGIEEKSMNNESAPPAPPPPEGKAPRKSHLGLIAGGAAVLFVLYLISGSGHGGAKSGGADAAVSSSAGGSSAQEAAAAPRAAGGNPILGRWNLLDTDATYCQSYQEFTASSSTSVVNGVKSTGRPIYNVHPDGKVIVGYGGTRFEEWDVNGPDDLNLLLISPYSVTSCRYHRA
jgi:hypothetical protein